MANSGIVGALRVLLGLDTAEFDAGIKKTKGQAQGLENDFKSFGKSFAGAFLPVAGVAGAGFALAAFAKQAFDTAGKVTDLADQTGLTTQSIQEMQAAANLTSTSLEAFTNAAFKLGVNLASGTDKVRAAVDALGLSYEMLRNQSPDEQFKTIASALGEVEDKQLRNKLAVDLFGRGAKEILPAIAQGYNDIAEAAGKAGDEQIRALDAAADAWGSFWNSAKALAIDVLGQVVINFRDSWEFMMQAPRKALEEWSAALEAMGLKTVSALPKAFGQAAKDAALLPPAIKKITLSLEEQQRIEKDLTKTAEQKATATVKAYDEQAAALRRFKADLDDFANKVKSLTSIDPLLFMGGAKFSQPIEEAKQSAAELAEEMYGWIPPIQASTFGMVEFKAAVKEVRTEVSAVGQSLKDGLLSVLETLPQTIASALQGGGGVTGAIKSAASQLGAEIGGWIGDKLGGDIGRKIGRAIGSLAGSLVDKFKGWLGFDDEADKMRNAIIKQFGSFQELERIAKSVGLTFVDVWKVKGKKGAEELQAAIVKLNAALDDQTRKLEEQREAWESDLDAARSTLDGLIGDAREMGYEFDRDGNLVSVSFQKMKDIAEKFGVSLEALGPKFHSDRIVADAKEIWNAITLLAKGGTDAGTILTGLKDEIGHLVSESIKFGTKIPENMRPWIQNLIDTGQLIDDNGQKITDISQINFGPPIESEFDTVQRAIKETIQAINDLIAKIEALIGTILSIPDKTVKINYETGPLPDEPPVVGEPDEDESGPMAPSGHSRPSGPFAGLGNLAGAFPAAALSSLSSAMNAAQGLSADRFGGMGNMTTALAGATGAAPAAVNNTYQITFEIHAIDGADVEQVTRAKIMPALRRDLSNNTGGARTGFLNDLGL